MAVTLKLCNVSVTNYGSCPPRLWPCSRNTFPAAPRRALTTVIKQLNSDQVRHHPERALRAHAPTCLVPRPQAQGCVPALEHVAETERQSSRSASSCLSDAKTRPRFRAEHLEAAVRVGYKSTSQTTTGQTTAHPNLTLQLPASELACRYHNSPSHARCPPRTRPPRPRGRPVPHQSGRRQLPLGAQHRRLGRQVVQQGRGGDARVPDRGRERQRQHHLGQDAGW